VRILIISADRTNAQGLAVNLGDAFLTDVLAQSLEQEGNEVIVADFGEVRDPLGRVQRASLGGLRGLWSITRAVDAIIVGGGTLFNDDIPKGFRGLPRLCLAASVVGWLTGRPVVFFGVGVESAARKTIQLAYRAAMWRRPVWTRDQTSAERCISLGSALFVAVAGDVCLAYPDGVLPTEARHRRGVVLALNHPDAAKLQAGTVESLHQRWSKVTFLSTGQGVESDADRLPAPVRTLFDSVVRDTTWERAFDTIGTADAVICSRMHAGYMAMLAGVAITSVNTRPKMNVFSEEFGIDSVGSIADVAASDPRVADEDSLSRARAQLMRELKAVDCYLRKKARGELLRSHRGSGRGPL